MIVDIDEECNGFSYMRLKVVEILNDDAEEKSLSIVLEQGGGASEYFIEDYESPFSSSYNTNFQWYYQSYFLDANVEDENIYDRLVLDKYITYGQWMGDKLLGEDHQLVKVKEDVDTLGIEQLRVVIESSSVEFFQDHWESLILPDSPFVLSSVVEGFERRFVDSTGKSLRDEEEKKVYDLSNDTPLTILRVVSDSGHQSPTSNLFSSSVAALKYNGALRYEVLTLSSISALKSRLSDSAKAIHILQLDIPVILDGDSACIPLCKSDTNNTYVSVSEVSQTLVEHGIGLLVVKECTAPDALALIARDAMRQGLGNIIGFSAQAHQVITEPVIQDVYGRFMGGLFIAQGVVEARKQQQSQRESGLCSLKELPFQVWPLLVHYGHQDVQFFASAQEVVDPYQSESFNAVRQCLYGYKGHYLPSQGTVRAESTFIDILATCQPGTLTQLTGMSGVGKTGLLHQLGFFLVQQGRVESSFYFDFNDELYNLEHIQEMLAPVFSRKPEDKPSLDALLHESHCHFVFENLDFTHQSQNFIAQFQSMVAQLLRMGQIVTITGCVEGLKLGEFSAVAMLPLSIVDAQIFAMQVVGKQMEIEGITGSSVSFSSADVQSLLEASGCVPFVIEKTFPLLLLESPEQVIKQALSLTSSNLVDQFYQLQFGKLDQPLRRLLLLLTELPGIWLEIIGLACHKKADSETASVASELFIKLGDESLDFTVALKKMRDTSFLQYQQHGSVICSSSLSFLGKQFLANDFLNKDLDSYQLALSRIVCQGVSLLISRLDQQQNPELKFHILSKRKCWSEHLERLWNEKDLGLFFSTRSTLGQLMQQENMAGEMSLWSLQLLQNSAQVPEISLERFEESIIWLLMANDALMSCGENDTIAPVLQQLGDTAQYWLDIKNKEDFLKSEDEKDKASWALFNHVTTYLGRYYQASANWSSCYEINLLAKNQFKQAQAWPVFVRCLTALSHCSTKLGQSDKALEFESEMLDVLPFSELSPMLKPKIILDILLMRIGRQDSVNAQDLFEDYKTLESSESNSDMLDNLQADIYMVGEKHLQARELYKSLYERRMALSGGAESGALESNSNDPYLIELNEKLTQLDTIMAT